MSEKKENRTNGKYGISGGNSEAPKNGAGQGKIGKMLNLHIFQFAPKRNKGVPHLQVRDGRAGAHLRYVGRVKNGTPTENTETAPDDHLPEVVPELCKGSGIPGHQNPKESTIKTATWHCSKVRMSEKDGVAFITVLAVLESTLPSSCLSYKIQCQEAAAIGVMNLTVWWFRRL